MIISYGGFIAFIDIYLHLFLIESDINKPELKETKLNTPRIAIIGAGNIGVSIASGLADSGRFQAGDITLTRRKIHLLEEQKKRGFIVESNNLTAVRNSDLIIIAVEPQQMNTALAEIKPDLQSDRHIVISVVTGVSTEQIAKQIGDDIPVVRAMPNTAIAVRESMTCLASNSSGKAALERENLPPRSESGLPSDGGAARMDGRTGAS